MALEGLVSLSIIAIQLVTDKAAVFIHNSEATCQDGTVPPGG